LRKLVKNNVLNNIKVTIENKSNVIARLLLDLREENNSEMQGIECLDVT